MPNGTIVTFANKEDKAIIVFSHHTSDTMDNPLIATGASVQPRVLGEDAKSGLWGINTAAHIDYSQQARVVEIAGNGDGSTSIYSTVIDHAGKSTFDVGSIEQRNIARRVGDRDHLCACVRTALLAAAAYADVLISSALIDSPKSMVSSRINGESHTRASIAANRMPSRSISASETPRCAAASLTIARSSASAYTLVRFIDMYQPLAHGGSSTCTI